MPSSLTIATGLLFGIAPAWHAAGTDLNEVLKQSTRASSGARPRLRNGLAAAELALATILLIGAGLLTQSLLRLQHVNLGFRSDRLLTFQVSLPRDEVSRREEHGVLSQPAGVVARDAGNPRRGDVERNSVRHRAAIRRRRFATTGPSPLPADAAVPTDWRIVSPGFFHAMEIPLLRGREFTDADAAAKASPIIVSQATAKRFWGDADPLGRTLHRQGDPARTFAVVGVVGDVRHTALARESPALYYPSGRVPRDGRRGADRRTADGDCCR